MLRTHTKPKIAQVSKTYKYMIEVTKVTMEILFCKGIFLCPFAVYMYKHMILSNDFSSESTWPFATKFNVDTTVETELRVCSNVHIPFTVMPLYCKIYNN